MLKKSRSVLLSFVLLLSLISAVRVNVSAAETDLEEVAASVDSENVVATKPQAEAVQWIKERAEEGWWEDVDGVFNKGVLSFSWLWNFLYRSRISV